MGDNTYLELNKYQILEKISCRIPADLYDCSQYGI